MTCNFTVTFEFETKPAIIVKGDVAGARATTVVALAVREAQRQYPRQVWQSMLVLVEKEGEDKKHAN